MTTTESATVHVPTDPPCEVCGERSEFDVCGHEVCGLCGHQIGLMIDAMFKDPEALHAIEQAGR